MAKAGGKLSAGALPSPCVRMARSLRLHNHEGRQRGSNNLREGDNGIAQAWISIMNYSNGTHSIAKIYSGTAIEGLTKAATKAALLFQ
ncbi:hypothetical protein [Vulcanisaeta sp. JCM 16159]|uniref:hypothetical protein n=1 Tax=Vulcanisaeta sp. JCM 16159 TaxID=1295371 RepID=UPI0006D041AB|nr:hypothetical protein [Vulcanisaeta sp. JCM 16159]